MKNNYQRLSKEEKKSVRKEFKGSSSSNKRIYTSARRLQVICIIGLLYSLFTFVFDFYYENGIFQFIMDGVLLLICFIGVLKVEDILETAINKYLIGKK